jgi:hypothetical protein
MRHASGLAQISEGFVQPPEFTQDCAFNMQMGKMAWIFRAQAAAEAQALLTVRAIFPTDVEFRTHINLMNVEQLWL